MSDFRASLRNAKEFQDNVFDFCSRHTFAPGGYREVVRFDLFGDHFLVNDPIEVGRILTSNPDDGAFTKRGLRFFGLMRRLLGQGLFTSEGAPHLRQRRLMQPHFNPGVVTAMAAGMIRAAAAQGGSWQADIDRVVDVERSMRQLSNDIAADALLGPDLRGEAHEFGTLADEEEEAIWLLMTAPFVLPGWIPTPSNRRLAAVAARIHDLVGRMIAKRRAALQAGAAPDVILTRLVAGQAEPDAMNDRQLFDEVVTLVVGGYKTLAVAHLWTFYLLAVHHAAAERVRAEVSAVVGDRAPAPDDLPRLAYTRMLVQEAMRLYPPIWGVFRIAAHDVEVGGAKVRRGATLFISPYTLHRNPKYWPTPGTFDPENFRPGVERPATAWLPFGAGRHKCIGTHYALAAVALSVATLCRRFAFDPPDAPIGLTTRSFTSPKGGMRLRLREIG